MAKFQTQVYAYILEPIIQKLGGVINRQHAVIFWNMNTFELIKAFTIPYYPAQTKEDIHRCLRAFKNPKEIIAPQEWKCKYCSKEHKEKCQFYGSK